MGFLERIFERLLAVPDHPVLGEVMEGSVRMTTAGQLLRAISAARGILRQQGLQPGGRCGLLGPNSPTWVAIHLAVLAEGGVLVPRYPRQSTAETVTVLRDAEPALIWCWNPAGRDEIRALWPDAPPVLVFEELRDVTAAAEVLAGRVGHSVALSHFPVAIIYTSGSTGEPKGAVLTAGNLDFVIAQTSTRAQQSLAGIAPEAVRVFHYLPLCFVGSWITLLTSLAQGHSVIFSTDLNRLAEEIALARPHYFQNVPAVLERFRTGITRHLEAAGRFPAWLFRQAWVAWSRKFTRSTRWLDPLVLWLARALLFSRVKGRFGPNLRALVCGSASLAAETQSFFEMLGLPIVQAYGLTETTAVCTMDAPGQAQPGAVGFALEGVEMRLGADQEIQVRGPNVFAGYWRRPAETAEAFQDGWFRTGDQGEVDEQGRWKITGRIKNILVAATGHNISPEPIEESLRRLLPAAEHVVVLGNDRKYLVAVVTGSASADQVRTALAAVNATLPHYKRVHKFYLSPTRFTVENGLLAGNHKLRRKAIEDFLRLPLDRLYAEGKENCASDLGTATQ